MRKFNISVNGKSYEVDVEEVGGVSTPAPAQAAPVEEETADDTDEEELIAVLTAAVAASLNTSTYNLRIKSYRRTDNKMPAWNKAGVTETINNRF